MDSSWTQLFASFAPGTRAEAALNEFGVAGSRQVEQACQAVPVAGCYSKCLREPSKGFK